MIPIRKLTGRVSANPLAAVVWTLAVKRPPVANGLLNKQGCGEEARQFRLLFRDTLCTVCSPRGYSRSRAPACSSGSYYTSKAVNGPCRQKPDHYDVVARIGT